MTTRAARCHAAREFGSGSRRESERQTSRARGVFSNERGAKASRRACRRCRSRGKFDVARRRSKRRAASATRKYAEEQARSAGAAKRPRRERGQRDIANVPRTSEITVSADVARWLISHFARSKARNGFFRRMPDRAPRALFPRRLGAPALITARHVFTKRGTEPVRLRATT